jgi:hypothetical protein
VVEWEDDMWHCSSEWLDATWPNQGLPRGTLVVVVNCCLLKCMESVGFDPRTSPPHNTSQTPITNRATTYALTYMWFGLNLKLLVGIVLGRDRAGPSPALGRVVFIYM